MREAYYQKNANDACWKKIQGLETEMLAATATKHARQGFLQFQSSPSTTAKLALPSPHVLTTHFSLFLTTYYLLAE